MNACSYISISIFWTFFYSLLSTFQQYYLPVLKILRLIMEPENALKQFKVLEAACENTVEVIPGLEYAVLLVDSHSSSESC